MNKKAIYAIIILMSAALLGIGIIQWFWIKWAVDLGKKNFDDRVITALVNVKDKLREDALTYEGLEKFRLGKDNPFGEKAQSLYDDIIRSNNSSWLTKKTGEEIRLNTLLLSGQSFFDASQKEKLDKYINAELNDQGVDLKFDYGVYSKESQSFIILNGNFAVNISDIEASNLETETERSLYDSDYEMQLIKPDESLKLYFPNQTSWLWSSVLPQMISSLIFTSLVLFCFIYTIYVIFKQKKISEITNDFINNMTHEFKTPIATISLAADSINSPIILSDENKIKRFIGIIKQENKRMLNQVEKVLQMALLEKEDFKLKHTAVPVNEVVRQAVQNAELTVQKRDGIIEVDTQAEPDIIEADLTHISNIIHNLLDNANKYSPEKPEIQVTTHNKTNGVEISIKDNGLGMSKEAIKHIFDKFYRVPTGNRHDVKGFGLGLSYVKAMVNAHKGTIQVLSELGKGSNFILFFPYRQ